MRRSRPVILSPERPPCVCVPLSNEMRDPFGPGHRAGPMENWHAHETIYCSIWHTSRSGSGLVRVHCDRIHFSTCLPSNWHGNDPNCCGIKRAARKRRTRSQCGRSANRLSGVRGDFGGRVHVRRVRRASADESERGCRGSPLQFFI